MGERRKRRRLVRDLQLSHAAERGAALAYAGHARACRDAADGTAIRGFSEDEWAHRREVATLLAALGARPQPVLEGILRLVGATLGFLCAVTPSGLPLWVAGWLEWDNVARYERAARAAQAVGELEMVPVLRELAWSEAEHDDWFRQAVANHAWARLLPSWPVARPEDLPPSRGAGPV